MLTITVAVIGVMLLIIIAVAIGMSMDTEAQYRAGGYRADRVRQLNEENKRLDEKRQQLYETTQQLAEQRKQLKELHHRIWRAITILSDRLQALRREMERWARCRDCPFRRRDNTDQ